MGYPSERHEPSVELLFVHVGASPSLRVSTRSSSIRLCFDRLGCPHSIGRPSCDEMADADSIVVRREIGALPLDIAERCPLSLYRIRAGSFAQCHQTQQGHDSDGDVEEYSLMRLGLSVFDDGVSFDPSRSAISAASGSSACGSVRISFVDIWR